MRTLLTWIGDALLLAGGLVAVWFVTVVLWAMQS